MLDKKIRMMRKIDLHCHLDGSLPVSTVSELLGREVDKNEMQADEQCASLKEYLQKFELPLKCMQTKDGLYRAAGDFLRSLKEDHVQYAEVRFAPMLSTDEKLGCREIMESVLDGLADASAECGVFYQVIVCAMRHHDAETNCRMLRECREFLGDGLCAADLAGDEAGFPTRNFAEVFRYAKQLDYPLTIHAGECGSMQSITEAIEMGAERIGHGIAMSGNQELQQLCRRKRIGIEMCPVSNYQTKAIAPGVRYPVREFLQNGVLATVNTDNRTVSNTNLKKEMQFLHEKFGITEEELRRLALNAVEISFADDSVKHELWKNLQ